MNFCYCRDTMDIRGRCLPCRDKKMFKSCRAKLDTALWIAENDYDFHNEFHNEKKRKGFHTKHFKRLFGNTINKAEGLILLSQAFQEEIEEVEEVQDEEDKVEEVKEFGPIDLDINI